MEKNKASKRPPEEQLKLVKASSINVQSKGDWNKGDMRENLHKYKDTGNFFLLQSSIQLASFFLPTTPFK